MQQRHDIGPRAGPTMTSPCIVMVCNDQSEAEQVGRLLAQHERSCLATYRRAEDLIFNSPRGRVAVVILAGDESAAQIARTLLWLRRRWPNCPAWVVGGGGDRELELAARVGGASYLVRPIAGEEWAAVIEHGLTQAGVPPKADTTNRPV